LCLKSGTKRADEIHDYYIKLEELMQETLREELQTKELETNNAKKLIEEKEIEYQRQLEENAKQLEEKEQELEMYKQKTYEDIERTGHIYVIKTDAQGSYKVGKTKDNVTKRIKGMQTANVNNIEIVLDYPTSNPDLLEKCVHYILDRYRCNSNREFFDCNIEYIKMIVSICGHTIDTLKSTYQHITKDELYSKMNRLGLEIKEYEIEHERIIDRFVKKYIRKGGDGVRWTELITTYNNWCYREVNERGHERLDKKDLKRYFEMYVFNAKEQPLRYVGRGWHGWSISK
jgi:hypothetical protein